jgi:hypothetical protein
MNIIGVCGQAGAGKDTIADFLVKDHKFVKLSFADPLKRICHDVFDFSEEQLWGPSSARNAEDKRYPRSPFGSEKVTEFLTPRYALQRLGTEFGRDCYAPIWVELAIRQAKTILEQNVSYDRVRGIIPNLMGPKRGVVIPDVRFRNELEAIKAAGGKVVRVVRPGAGLEGAAALHPSEVEMQSIPDSDFDRVIVNNGSLQDLKTKVLVTRTYLCP